MKLTLKILGGLGVVGLIVLLIMALNRPKPLGQAIPGSSTNVATSSTVAIGQNSVVVLFATTTTVTASTSGGSCSSRTVSAKADPVLIMFSPGMNKGLYGSTSLQLGFYDYIVPASTTATFDSGLFGCGAWVAKGAGVSSASTTIGVTESR